LFTNFDISLIEGWLPPYTQVDFKVFNHNETAKVLVDLSMLDDINMIKSFMEKKYYQSIIQELIPEN